MRGISEALAVIIILAITTSIFSILAISSQQALDRGERSIMDSIEISQKRINELLSMIYVAKDGIYADIFVVNYGSIDILIDNVLKNGAIISNVEFRDMDDNLICNLNSNDTCSIPKDEIRVIRLEAASNDSIQILSVNGSIFEIVIP